MRATHESSPSISERLLLSLSRRPKDGDYPGQEPFTSESALSLLCRVFPDFISRIQGKSVLDFGCGAGLQAIAMAKNGALYVFGLDSNDSNLARANDLAMKSDARRLVEFGTTLPPRLLGSFDFVISQNSMEHFLNPGAVVQEMSAAVKTSGSILITFGPPWYSPYGSHMQFFTKVPWLNLLFSERTVMNVRAQFRRDGARHYEEVEAGLGKMTVRKFERVLKESGMNVCYCKYECVQRLHWLQKIPVMRELFINQISCELRRFPV